MKENDCNNGFLTIKEFAELVGVTQEILRHYDRIGVFKPVTRGTGRENNYRCYAQTQITTFNMIRVLTGIGVPLKTIQAFVENRSPENLIKLLCKYNDILTYNLAFI